MLWNEIISEYLEQDLWDEINIYDAGHVLQVPLEAAFKSDNLRWKKEFSDHFIRFTENYYSKDTNVEKSRLDLLHYLYLSSRFVDLACQYEDYDLIPEDLPQIIYSNIESMWKYEDAWQWNTEPFKNMKERIVWKLDTKDVEWSYYRAIIDEELFVFAIAADLSSYYKEDEIESTVLNEILQVGYNVFQDEGTFEEDGGWMFQNGVWKDHPDYAYAGNLKKQKTIQKIKVKDIAIDSSHFSRFPLFIKSFKRAYRDMPEKLELFESIQLGLEKQFLEYVLIEPNNEFNGYRLNNYMDGRNGLYRWNYPTQGIGNGYGEYELSGTFFLGWWSFLDSQDVSKAYDFMSMAFPLDDKMLKTYVGPNTTREVNNYVKWPEFFENGFSELICKLIVIIK